MAISKELETQILKVVAGLFDAAPGGTYLTQLANMVSGGMSISQLSDYLASTSLFTNSIMAGKVTVDDQAAVNAVALPAGNIVVFKGLLSELKTENEVAMILAHELGHYAHRDHLRGLGRGLVLLSISALLGLSGDLPGFIAPSVLTFDLKHSRDRESAADRYAIDLFARAYGHAGGTTDVFKVLASHEGGIKRPDIISTHPDTLWRMQTLASYLQLKKYPIGPIIPLPESGVLPFLNDRKGKVE